ncbi:MAG: PaaI family thioesterase [Planctomycetota bacterium]|nr:PaaI family thioesterase [Planctomycetota bacterium]
MSSSNGNDWAKIMGRDAYAILTGLEVLRADPGLAEVRLAVTPQVVNGHGSLHGGALFTLADYAAAIAANLNGGPSVAANATISYLKPVREGWVTAKAITVRNGRRMKVQRVDVFDSQGELCAIFQCGAMTVSLPNSGGGPA